jgi:hypothetical protein
MSNIIGEVKKSMSEKIVCQIVERGSKLKIDMRSFFRPTENEWLPTKKGITVDVGAWPELKKVLDKLDAEVAKLGIR